MAVEDGRIDGSVVPVRLTNAQRRYVSWTADLLVYTVVLNLFVEYVDGVRIDSFSLSVLTAVLLKLMLVALSGAESAVHRATHNRGSRAWRVVGSVTIFLMLFASKFLILEVVDVVFAGEVELGHFVEVAALVIAMLAARAIMDRTFVRLGKGAVQPE